MKKRNDQIPAEIQPWMPREVDLGNYHPVSEHKESECEALNDKQIAKPVLNRTQNHYTHFDFNTVALVRCISNVFAL